MTDEKNTNKERNFKQQFKELMQNTVIAPNDDYKTKMQPIKELIKENTPASLFRFRAVNEFSLDAFRKDDIYHSEPKNFNDPHDCLVYFDKPLLDKIRELYLKPQNVETLLKQFSNLGQISGVSKEYLLDIQKVVKNLSITGEDWDNILKLALNNLPDIDKEITKSAENIEENMYNHYKTYPKIACFSENIESTLMWSHYADSHKGFALEYDFTKEQKCLVCTNPCEDFVYISLYPVIYTNTRYNATDLAASLQLNQYLRNFGIPIHTIPDELAYTKTNIYKGEDWKYEKEWRTFLIYDRKTERKAIKIKPKAVYLGVNISEIYQDILVGYAKAYGIETYKMKVDIYSDEFKLIYESV